MTYLVVNNEYMIDISNCNKSQLLSIIESLKDYDISLKRSLTLENA